MTVYPRFRVVQGNKHYHGARLVEAVFRLANWWLLRFDTAAEPANQSRLASTAGMRAVHSPRWRTASALVLAVASSAAAAQDWPTKPITAVVPFGAGSVTDVLPRVVFEQLSRQLGQNIIVENRPGAGTTTASTQVARAEPDGHTILVNSSAHTIAPALYSKLNYDPVRDLTAVVPLGMVPSVLVVPPSRGYKTMADFIAAAKANPGAMNFASAGVGTATHLGAVRLQNSVGIQAAHVPFKGGPESMGEVIAGRIDFFMAPIGVALQHVQDGKLAALAVNSDKRSSALPNVPTTKETGLADAEYPFWIGVLAPAKTPRSIIDRLHAETVKALATPSVREKIAAMSIDPMPMTPTEFAAYIEKQIPADAALAKAADIKPQQ